MAIETRITPQMTAEYQAKGYWPGITVGEKLDRMAGAFPNKTAIVDSHRRVTFAELRSLANRMALGFDRVGIKRGDRVTAQLPNSVEALAVYFALAKIGGVLCHVVPYYRSAEVRYILNLSGSVAYILPDKFGGFDYLQMLEEMRPSVPDLKHVIVMGDDIPPGAVSLRELIDDNGGSSATADMKARLASLKPDPNDPLALMFTSGTESAPKAPIWTHNTINTVRFYDSGWRFTDKDVVMCLAPAYHAFGMGIGCHTVLAEYGATSVWMDAFDPEEALRIVEREKVTAILGVPPQLFALVDHPNRKKYDLSSLRFFNTAGAPTPAEWVRKLKTELGCAFLTLWGSSECIGGTITRLDDPPELAATTVGRSSDPAVELAVFDDNRENILPPGHPGELAIRSPGVCVGYFRDPERTRSSFHADGWFFTGDCVSIGEDGYVRFVSRIKDIINRGGEKVSPMEVEQLLHTHPKISAAAMVGMPDARLGERNCLFLVLRQGEVITLEEVVSFLTGRGLAKFKLPERLVLIESLPMTASGKVRKNVLREEAARKLQPDREEAS